MTETVQPERSPQDQLDEFLEKYLNLLDAYERARKDLSQNLSSGFISLAQANFSSSGPRIGQDLYDDRTQASRRVAISDSLQISVTSESLAKEEQSDAKVVDPIKWFGMMTPPALKSSQASFVRAVESSIPNLINLASEIKALEISIGRLQKSLRKSATSR